MNNRFAMFPGSFDPVTNGHIDIIKRSSLLYDKLFVVVAENRQKTTLFSAEERLAFLNTALQNIKNVEIVIWDGLIVDFAKKNNVGVVVRGVRTTTDFDYEFEVSELCKKLCPELEYLFMPTSSDFSLIRSSSVKELASFHADVSSMVPKDVAKALLKKYKG